MLAHRLIALTLCLLAVGVRLWHLGDAALWLDEAFTWQNARQPIDLIVGARVDVHPPLYYGLLHYWLLLAGHPEYALRLPSALLSTLLVPAAWVLARRLSIPSAGGAWLGPLTAALLLTLSPTLVGFAREARMYGVIVALGAIALAAADRVAQRPTGWRWLGYVVATLLALATHYAALAAWAAAALGLLLRVRRIGVLGWLAANGAIAAIATLWTRHLLANQDAWAGLVWHPWATPTAPAAMAVDWLSAAAGRPLGPQPLPRLLEDRAGIAAVALLFALALVGLLAALLGRSRSATATSHGQLGDAQLEDSRVPLALALLALAAAPPLAIGLVDSSRPSWNLRYTVVAFPALALLAAGGAAALVGAGSRLRSTAFPRGTPADRLASGGRQADRAVVSGADGDVAQRREPAAALARGRQGRAAAAASDAQALPIAHPAMSSPRRAARALEAVSSAACLLLGLAAALAVLALPLPALPAALAPQREDWRAVARFVRERGRPSDVALGAVQAMAEYYLSPILTVRQRPIALGRPPEEVVAELETRTHGSEHVWLVPRGDALMDPTDVVGTVLARYADGREDGDPGGLSLTRLGLRPRERLALGPTMRPIDATFGGTVHLVAYAAERARAAGAPIAAIALDLRLEGKLTEDYKLFAHLLDGSQQTVAQQDVLLVDSVGRPTSQLEPGTRLRVDLSIGGPAEKVTLGRAVGIGLYQLAPPGARLPLVPPAPEHRLILPLQD